MFAFADWDKVLDQGAGEGGVVLSVLLWSVFSAVYMYVLFSWYALYVVLNLTRVILVEGAGRHGCARRG